MITGCRTIFQPLDGAGVAAGMCVHTSGENIVDNGDLGRDSLGMIRGQAGSSGNPSQDPPRVIFCSSQWDAPAKIGPDLVKDMLFTGSTAATTTTMRYIR